MTDLRLPTIAPDAPLEYQALVDRQLIRGRQTLFAGLGVQALRRAQLMADGLANTSKLVEILQELGEQGATRACNRLAAANSQF